MALKDILIEKGTGFREQLTEIAQGFPRVKKALNIRESADDGNDSQDEVGSALDDDEAFEKVEKTILASYQQFLKHKHGEPGTTDTRVPSSL